MKFLALLMFQLGCFELFAQQKIVGDYRDYFGSHIQLNADKTFKYTWSFDLSASWTKGTWLLKNDTVYFSMIPTYDTISVENDRQGLVDKLILSTDEMPERLTQEQYAGTGLSSSGQNRVAWPEKLFFKKGKLFLIKNGKLVKQKSKGISGSRRWRPWYFKSDD